MNVTTLVSAGQHPVSGDAILPRLEAQMVRIAAALGTVRGLHAGPAAAPASDSLGHGLLLLDHLRIDADADPVPVLVEALSAAAPDLILAGRRSQGNEETGLVPYALAKALSLTIVADAIAIAPGLEPGTLLVDQALPKGAGRRLTVRLPALVTVHPSAPPPLPFAYGQARRGRIETVEPAVAAEGAAGTAQIEERPYRARPKMMRSAPAGASATERLKAATGEAGAGKANVLINPEPAVAAREILAYLRRIGVLRSPA